MPFRRRPLTSGAQTFLRAGMAITALTMVVHIGRQGVPDLATTWRRSVGGKCTMRCTGSPHHSSAVSIDRNSAVWTYTAYYDEAASAIIAISETAVQSYAKPYYCHVWTESDRNDDGGGDGADNECSFAAETASVLSVKPGERRSLLTVLRCRSGGHAFDSSTRLAITDSESCLRSGGGGSVPVHQRPQRTGTPAGGRTVQFAVCCLPEWDAAQENVEPENIVSFIESNSILGAERFYFYNSSNSTTKIDQIIGQYVADGLVTVVQWPKRLDAFSLKAARQDCMQRSSAEAEYVIYLSLNDVLEPTTGATWKDVVKQSQPAQPAVYLFTSVLIGVPSIQPCPIQNSSLTQIAAKVKPLRYTLFGGVSGAASGDNRFYRAMYNLARVHNHPSVYDDWLTRVNLSVIDGAPEQLTRIVRLDASSATVKHYNEQALAFVDDSRRLRRLPLRYSPSLCGHSDRVLRRILTGCPLCSRW